MLSFSSNLFFLTIHPLYTSAVDIRVKLLGIYNNSIRFFLYVSGRESNNLNFIKIKIKSKWKRHSEIPFNWQAESKVVDVTLPISTQCQYDLHLCDGNHVPGYLPCKWQRAFRASVSGASSPRPCGPAIILHCDSFTRLWETDAAVIRVWHNR